MNIRTIRRKIRAVNNIKKITKAMQLVSAAKMKKVQERLMTLRPYASKIQEFLEGLAGQVKDLNYPLFMPREKVKTIGLAVVMADKGLCGSFNTNMIRFAANYINQRQLPVKVMAIGRRSAEYFKRRDMDVVESHVNIPTEVPFAQVRRMTHTLVGMFEQGTVDEVHILYTEYVNALTFRPGRVQFLPIEASKITGKERKLTHEYLFEPEPAKILERLIPKYVETTFHRLLLESMSSEHAARMNAMRNATDNAEELVEGLTQTYNKARQGGITKELLDIVGGAEALK